jgi:predicted house-cleaning noncanonical NTP pyrophosphatase (MazG superfamily)
MTAEVIFSDDGGPTDWLDIDEVKQRFGTKAATLTTIPRNWTPPFVLVSATVFGPDNRHGKAILQIGDHFLSRVQAIAGLRGALIVRSSVLGETIWDRGTYESVVIDDASNDFNDNLLEAVQKVLASASTRRSGVILQSYVAPRARGEFGNLLRVSKTRDQWELTYEVDNLTSTIRFNVQRDRAADPSHPIEIKAGVALERLIGPVCAWLNNELLQGISLRLNCEWVTDNQNFYIVQVDQEDEDFVGINPFQLRIAPIHQAQSSDGSYIRSADTAAINEWDKLRVLDELHEENEPQRPTLFYLPLASLPNTNDREEIAKLENDFLKIVGPDNIIIRTSVRAGKEKEVNLPRTEGLRPNQAAQQCLQWRDDFAKESRDLNRYAFVVHRFIAARAGAWVRAEPDNPLVEIHGLWGLPDALLYCPYDIWEVHIPTSIATEFAEYKPHMLIADADGNWRYVRVKNEFGRSLSIGRREAIEIANRTHLIAQRLGRACHVMWFVGCTDSKGTSFNLPWYWTEAHAAEKNLDRTNYRLFRIENRNDLETFQNSTFPKSRFAIELMPKDLSLFRDMKFIEIVGRAAKEAGVPVIIEGSTLAHAYFALRRIGCTVLPRGEKEHTRIRRSTNFGKIVRDKIPARIAARQEAGATRKLANNLKLNFLISKLLEEALEVRGAETPPERKTELADVIEIVRALAQMEGFSLDDIIGTANEKRAKAGGFEEGLILLQTGILGSRREGLTEDGKPLTQVLARKTAGDTFELPFTFFGFMEIDQPRSIVFEDFGIRLYITLKNDRIEFRIARGAEQLELPLDLTVS